MYLHQEIIVLRIADSFRMWISLWFFDSHGHCMRMLLDFHHPNRLCYWPASELPGLMYTIKLVQNCNQGIRDRIIGNGWCSILDTGINKRLPWGSCFSWDLFFVTANCEDN